MFASGTVRDSNACYRRVNGVEHELFILSRKNDLLRSIFENSSYLQLELEITGNREIYQKIYKSDFEEIIKMGAKSDKYEMELGVTYVWFEQIKEKATALLKNHNINIFNVCDVAKRCSHKDLYGFSELYKPLFRGAIEEREKMEDGMWNPIEEEDMEDDLSMLHNIQGMGKAKGTRRGISCSSFMKCICGFKKKKRNI